MRFVLPTPLEIEMERTRRAAIRNLYRFYARRTPGDLVPAVFCGETEGPNVYCHSHHRTMTGARIRAWLENRKRTL